MRKLLVIGLLAISTLVHTAEIPKGSKVLYFVTESAGSLRNKLQSLSEQYTILDWQVSMGLGYGVSNHDRGEVEKYLLVVIVKQE